MIKVLSARVAPNGFSQDCIGLVTFHADLCATDQVKVTRYVKDSKKDYDVAIVAGAQSVKVIDAQLLRGKTAPWIALRNLSLPRELLDEVAAAAIKMLDPKASAAASANAAAT